MQQKQRVNRELVAGQFGLYFAFGIGIVGLLYATVVGILGQPTPASVIGGGTLVSLVGAFIYGSRITKQEKEAGLKALVERLHRENR